MSYKRFIYGSATRFDMENNGIWQLADTNGDGSPDLVYIKTRNTGSGRVEVHITRNESLFQEQTVSTPTMFAAGDEPTYSMLDYTGDGKADLVQIRTQNTGTGYVEVMVADAASGFDKLIGYYVSCFPCGLDGQYSLSDKGDLVYTHMRNTGSGRVQVMTALKSMGYLVPGQIAVTGFTQEDFGTWTMAPKTSGNYPNFYYIKTKNTKSGMVELCMVSSQSNWTNFEMIDVVTGFTAEQKGTWCLSHFSHQREPDLVYIKNQDCASGKIEVYIVQPYDLKPNSFLATSRNVRLEGSILRGELKRHDGSYRDAQVDLDSLLGNNNGVLDWGTRGFHNSARNIRLTDTALICELQTTTGSWVDDSIDIHERIFNNDGVFKAVEVPVIIAIPKGQEQDFLNVLSKAAKTNPNFKLEVGNPDEDGSTVWRYNAGISSTLDDTGYFRTYGAEVSAKVFEIGNDADKDIETVQFSFGSAGVSAKTDRLEHFKLAGTYAGAEAHYNVVEGKVGCLDFNVGLGVEAGVGFKDQSLELNAGIIGVTIGRKMGISFLGSSISVDLGGLVRSIGALAD